MELDLAEFRKSAKKGVASSNVCRKNYSLDIFSHFFGSQNSIYSFIFLQRVENHTITSTFELLPQALRMHE